MAHPTSVSVATNPGRAAFPGPCWVKRGDVHATEAGDVCFNGDAAALDASLARFAARGIARAVVQDHVPGDLIKFYGVAGVGENEGRPSWFEWFYHRDQRLSNHPFDPRRWPRDDAGRRGARARRLRRRRDRLGRRRHLRDRPQRLAELRPVPSRGRRAHRRAARRAVHAAWESRDDGKARQTPRSRRALEEHHRARGPPHRARPAGLRAVVPPGDGPRRGHPHRRGRQPLHRLHRRHQRRQPRPLPPAYVGGPPDQAGEPRLGGQLHHRESASKSLDLLASVTPGDLDAGRSSSAAAPRRWRPRSGSPCPYTKKHEIVGFWGGFHGKTGGVMGADGDDFKHGWGPSAGHASRRPTPTATAARSTCATPTAASPAPSSHAQAIKRTTSGAVAAIIVEPMQGTAGNVIPPPEFLPAIQEHREGDRAPC